MYIEHELVCETLNDLLFFCPLTLRTLKLLAESSLKRG